MWALVDGIWSIRVRGHALWVRDGGEPVFWWITSDKDGQIVTARGEAETLELAQFAALAEAKVLAYGALSTRAFLPSELAAIRDGTIQKLGGKYGGCP
jgi:hypothetical protein